ncbi:MAG: DNA internalization-related competence protein ComEC/Rec2, partial [Candidatus Eisenbacteria sp.]|nr:DNA internalization-related competence protein ComEC/Rec2 [Candidatus Eisenbacteria bacterium]
MPACPLSLRRAPLLKVVPVFALGILVQNWFGVPLGWIAITLAGILTATLGLVALGRRGCGRWRGIVTLVAVFIALALGGALRLELQDRGLDESVNLADSGTERRVAGRIVDAPKVRGEGLRFDLGDLEWETPAGPKSIAGGVRVWVREPGIELAEGDWVEITGKIRRPSGRRNPAGFDYESYLGHRGIWGLVSVYDPSKITRLGGGFRGWLPRSVFKPIKEKCDACLDRHLQGRSLALVSGLLLGERDKLTQRVQRTLRSAGVLHILTVSGLHVGLVVGMVLLLGKALRVPLTLRVVLALGVCFLYAGVVGNRAPVIRASIMATAALGGYLLQRDSPAINTLCLAALVLLLVHPGSLWEMGFQLSFGAVFGIVAFFPVLRNMDLVRSIGKRRGVSWIVDGLLVSLSAQLGVGPLIAYHFSQWTPVSPLANLLVLPQVGIGLPLAGMSIVVAGVSDTAAHIPFAALWAILKVLWSTVVMLSELPGAAVVVKRPGVWIVAATYAALVLGFVSLSLGRWKGTGIAALCLLVLLLLYADPVRPERLEVTVLDVGLGSAAVVRLPSGKTVLVDGGDRSEYRDYGAQVVVPYLRSRGVDDIDLVILSHPHRDHFGGLIAVVEELSVRRLADPGLVAATEEYRDFLVAVRDRDIDFRIVRGREKILFDESAVIELIPIDRESRCRSLGRESVRLNNGSLVVRIRYGASTLLLTGDIEACRELDLLRSGEDLANDVIVVPHHGSASSSLPEFIEAVGPGIAIVSAGKKGRLRLPSRDVIRRYQDAGARVFRTDQSGAVIVTSDGERMWIRCEIEEDRKTWGEKVRDWVVEQIG